MEFFAVDIEQAREEEASGGPWDEDVAVERARPVALDPAAPDFVARAIIADRRGHAHGDHVLARARGERLFDPRRRLGTVGAEVRGNGELRILRQLDELGGFDDAFFAYHEDADLCWRARQRGMTLRLVHAAGVLHHYEFSRNPRKMYLMERNRLLFVLTTFEAKTLAVLAVPMIGFELALLLVAWRQGWAREKARGWAWLARNGAHIRARRREVGAARRVGDDVLSELLTATFDPAQLPIPAAGRPLEVVLRVWWRVGRRALGGRKPSQP